MGFFADLKDDLSVAVNEMLTEENETGQANVSKDDIKSDSKDENSQNQEHIYDEDETDYEEDDELEYDNESEEDDVLSYRELKELAKSRSKQETVLQPKVQDLCVTIFDAEKEPFTIRLIDYKSDTIYFGRDEENEITLASKIVSKKHGRFHYKDNQWYIEDKGVYEAQGSSNGLIYNDYEISSRMLCEGDLFRIDDGVETIQEGVLFIISKPDSINVWKTKDIKYESSVIIGRGDYCDIVLPHISVSNRHAKIVKDQDKHYISCYNNSSGVILNNHRITGKVELHEKDVIVISNSKLVFNCNSVFYCSYKTGFSVDVDDALLVRGHGRRRRIYGRDINVNIKPGEFIGIIGGSGAGKSTVLKCMNGYLKPEAGSVYINGVDLYQNFELIKKLIGYVPQQDIVYNQLTVYGMLSYAAKLRLPKDTSYQELENAINSAIKLVELEGKKNSLISSLSGGQKKRASIAVELLSDPNLLFLDEPASGLDPGTERSLMESLRQMADNGKTIIMVTHSTLQLELFDKIMFMGPGGKLCFFGSYKEALDFFEVPSIIDVYDLISNNTDAWKGKYDSTINKGVKRISDTNKEFLKKKIRGRFQFPILCKRYINTIVRDKIRVFFLLVQGPAIAGLIWLVSNGEAFNQYEMTKSLLFVLACTSFWLGMFDSIQEICKEKSILVREYMTGLSLTGYVCSKIFIISLLCIVQSLSMIAVFSAAVGMPETGLVFHPFIDMMITTVLSSIAAASTGLFVSTLSKTPELAMTMAPFMIIPQLLFSGVIFKLSGFIEKLSVIAVCRWGMEAYGSISNLNGLQLRLQQEGLPVPHEAESLYEFTESHLMKAWGILVIMTVVFLIATRITVIFIRYQKEESK